MAKLPERLRPSPVYRRPPPALVCAGAVLKRGSGKEAAFGGRRLGRRPLAGYTIRRCPKRPQLGGSAGLAGGWVITAFELTAGNSRA